MMGGKKDDGKAGFKGADKDRLEDGAEAPETASQAGKRKRRGEERADGASAAPARTGRPKGTRNKSETPGRVVAIGVDVPKLSELEAEKLEREAVEQEAKRRRPGQPTGYRPEYAEKARLMCKFGATDYELAEEFGVNTTTIWLWRCRHEEFFNALSEGKDAWDERAERALAIRAMGYSVHVEKLFHHEGQIIRAETVEHYPPDVGALKMSLGNRKPDQWRDKQEVKVDGSDAFLKLWTAITDGTIKALVD